jgi:hypothetical protein
VIYNAQLKKPPFCPEPLCSWNQFATYARTSIIAPYSQCFNLIIPAARMQEMTLFFLGGGGVVISPLLVQLYERRFYYWPLVGLAKTKSLSETVKVT